MMMLLILGNKDVTPQRVAHITKNTTAHITKCNSPAVTTNNCVVHNWLGGAYWELAVPEKEVDSNAVGLSRRSNVVKEIWHQ